MATSINFYISGSENIIERFKNEANLLEPINEMVSQITSLFGSATREAAVVDTGYLRDSIMDVIKPLAGTVGMATFVPYARYNAFGAPKRNFLARHAEGGVPVVDGYGYTNYAFNTSLKEAWQMAFAARDEVIRRLSE